MNQEEKGNQKGRENKKQKQEEFTTAKMGLANKDENPHVGVFHCPQTCYKHTGQTHLGEGVFYLAGPDT